MTETDQVAIAERVDQRTAWVSEQELKIEAAWAALSYYPATPRGGFCKRLKEKYLGPGDRAPHDFPIRIIDRVLLRLHKMRLDPEPAPSAAFVAFKDRLITPKDQVSFELGSNTYLPESVRILHQVRRARAS